MNSPYRARKPGVKEGLPRTSLPGPPGGQEEAGSALPNAAGTRAGQETNTDVTWLHPGETPETTGAGQSRLVGRGRKGEGGEKGEEEKKIQTWYDHRLGYFLHSGSYFAFAPVDTGVTLTSRYTGLVSASRERVQPKTNTHTPRVKPGTLSPQDPGRSVENTRARTPPGDVNKPRTHTRCWARLQELFSPSHVRVRPAPAPASASASSRGPRTASQPAPWRHLDGRTYKGRRQHGPTRGPGATRSAQP